VGPCLLHTQSFRFPANYFGVPSHTPCNSCTLSGTGGGRGGKRGGTGLFVLLIGVLHHVLHPSTPSLLHCFHRGQQASCIMQLPVLLYISSSPNLVFTLLLSRAGFSCVTERCLNNIDLSTLTRDLHDSYTPTSVMFCPSSSTLDFIYLIRAFFYYIHNTTWRRICLYDKPVLLVTFWCQWINIATSCISHIYAALRSVHFVAMKL
jgi:hypothetical protein